MTERSLLATYPTQTIRLGEKKKKVTTGRAAEVTAVQAETGRRLMVSSNPPPPPSKTQDVLGGVVRIYIDQRCRI